MCKITKLFEIMKQRGIKAKELSEAIGASTGNISDWKSGRSSPNIEVLPKIAEFFNVSTDYLLGLDDVPNRNAPLSDDIQELIDLYSSLPERKQGEVKGFIKALIEPSSKTANGADNDIIETPKGRYKVAHAAAFGGGTMDILIPADVSYDEINRLIDENKALQRHRKNEKVADELIEKIKNKE